MLEEGYLLVSPGVNQFQRNHNAGFYCAISRDIGVMIRREGRTVAFRTETRSRPPGWGVRPPNIIPPEQRQHFQGAT